MEDLSPKERRQERTRQAILATALELITRNGLDKLSLREIARRIDYSPAGLYEYFGSKDEIVTAVAHEGHQRMWDLMARVPADLPPKAYLIELGVAYIEFARLHSDYFKLMFNEMASSRMTHTDLTVPEATSTYDLLVQGVRQAVKAGVITGADEVGIQGIAYSLWALVHGLSMLQLTYLRSFQTDFAQVDRFALEKFVNGLA